MGAVRVLCNSAVAHGWTATTPADELTAAGQENELPQSSREVLQMADRGCKHLPECADCHVVKLVRREEIAWKAPLFTVVSTLHKILKHLVWTETAAFRWKHDTAGEIDMGTLMEKESQQARAAHQIRESFRENSWNLFFRTT